MPKTYVTNSTTELIQSDLRDATLNTYFIGATKPAKEAKLDDCLAVLKLNHPTSKSCR
jgi:hypothetical protein